MTDPARDGRSFLVVLAGAGFVEWLGASAILPLLPTYLRHHGTSPAMVGLVMSSFFLASLVLQYPLGHLGDRIGHRPVLVGGLVVYALGSLGFLLDPGAGGYVALRAMQGAGSGAVQIASFALVGIAVPSERRGRAFSTLFAAQLGGAAIGPLAGSIAGVSGMGILFTTTAVTSAIAGVWVVAKLPALRSSEHGTRTPLVISRMLVGVILAGVTGGLIQGVYETCWTLLLDHRGAHAWQVGLSWTLFAAPFAAVSPIAGRLVDRFDRVKLATWGMASSIVFAALYPFLHSLSLLLGLGAVESIGVAIAYPAAQSLLSDSVPESALGRAQGLNDMCQTGAIAAAAGVAGALFAVAPWVPFVGSAALAAVLVAVLQSLWREGHTSAGVDIEPRELTVIG
ncbi:MAG: MFS transporter [Frankiaceae bacterium]|nr:MFS transporter [Frankiaceae bacterium]MBV9872144.1 MFS transporter [Frankiaceae bacterium]